jgi:uncharacterized protein (UPF0371 family)
MEPVGNGKFPVWKAPLEKMVKRAKAATTQNLDTKS